MDQKLNDIRRFFLFLHFSHDTDANLRLSLKSAVHLSETRGKEIGKHQSEVGAM